MLTAWVTSVEDHGYIVSFGLSSKKTGFLLNKNAQQYIKTCNNGLFVCVCVRACVCMQLMPLNFFSFREVTEDRSGGIMSHPTRS